VFSPPASTGDFQREMRGTMRQRALIAGDESQHAGDQGVIEEEPEHLQGAVIALHGMLDR